MPADKVYLVDDDERIIRALVRALKPRFDVHAFGSGGAFLAHPGLAAPACVLLDLLIGDGSGLDVQRALAEAHPSIKVVFLTGQGDIGSSVAAMKAGAFDFLEKPVEIDRLEDAVRRAVDASREHHDRERARRSFLARLARLTPRERQVCDLVVLGRLNKQIGLELGAAEKTIKIHRSHVMEKLGVRSVAELVRLIERSGSDASSVTVARGRDGRSGHDVIHAEARIPGHQDAHTAQDAVLRRFKKT
jgi:FixJ family two-component response regulator